MVLVITIAVIGLVGLTGCKKKEQPATPKSQTMEGMTHQMTSTLEEANQTAQTGLASIEQKTCPVTGDKIDKNVFVEYKGKKVYFCCSACKAKFEANPEKYVGKLPQFAK
jgi:YHS domain-containing protein